jgi:hypothetical protein
MNIIQYILFFPAPHIQPMVLFLQGKILLLSHCPIHTTPFFTAYKNTAGKLKQEMLFSKQTKLRQTTLFKMLLETQNLMQWCAYMCK